MNLLMPFAHTIPGGIARVAVSLVAEFIRSGDCVVVTVPAKEVEYFRNIFPKSSNFHLYPDTGVNDLKGYIEKHSINRCLVMNPESLPQASPDAARFDIPTTLIVHDVFWAQFQGDDYTTLANFGQSVYDLHIDSVDNIIVPSHYTRQELLHAIPTSERKITCIPHAPDTPSFLKKDASLCLSRKKQDFSLYYPSSATGNKDHLLLFQAVKMLIENGSSFSLDLSGWETDRFDSENPLIFARAEKARCFYKENRNILREHVRLHGYADYSLIEDLYDACDVVVLPSLYEGFGLGLIEAVARGVRVLCSDIPPFLEQISFHSLEPYVTTFRSGDIEDLVGQLLQLNTAAKSNSICIPPGIITRTWKDVAGEYRTVLSR